MLQWLREYKHIIVRVKIQKYFISVDQGPFGLGTDINKIILEDKSDKWSLEQKNLVKMIHNINSYNLFNNVKFNRVLENLLNPSDEEPKYSRRGSNYLPIVYSNFDDLGFRQFSAYLTYKNLNHINHHYNSTSSEKENLNYLSNIPYYKLSEETQPISKISHRKEKLVNGFINMYHNDTDSKYYYKNPHPVNKEVREGIKQESDNNSSGLGYEKYEGKHLNLSPEILEGYSCVLRFSEDITIRILDNEEEKYTTIPIFHYTLTQTKYYEKIEETNEKKELGLDRLEETKASVSKFEFNRYNMDSIDENHYKFCFPNNSNFLRNTPVCALLNNKITEGIDFPLSPAIHVLEVPDGFGVANQIYARIMRNISNFDKYDYSSIMSKYIQKTDAELGSILSEYEQIYNQASDKENLTEVINSNEEPSNVMNVDNAIEMNKFIGELILNLVKSLNNIAQNIYYSNKNNSNDSMSAESGFGEGSSTSINTDMNLLEQINKLLTDIDNFFNVKLRKVKTVTQCNLQDFSLEDFCKENQNKDKEICKKNKTSLEVKKDYNFTIIRDNKCKQYENYTVKIPFFGEYKTINFDRFQPTGNDSTTEITYTGNIDKIKRCRKKIYQYMLSFGTNTYLNSNWYRNKKKLELYRETGEISDEKIELKLEEETLDKSYWLALGNDNEEEPVKELSEENIFKVISLFENFISQAI